MFSGNTDALPARYSDALPARYTDALLACVYGRSPGLCFSPAVSVTFHSGLFGIGQGAPSVFWLLPAEQGRRGVGACPG